MKTAPMDGKRTWIYAAE